MSKADNPYDSPHSDQTEPPVRQPGQEEGDATGGVIPYKNMPALIAYYLGILSPLACVGIGLIFSVPALVLGIMGLRKRAQNPAVKGSVHAWIGVISGGICTVVGVLFVVMMIIGMAAG